MRHLTTLRKLLKNLILITGIFSLTPQFVFSNHSSNTTEPYDLSGNDFDFEAWSSKAFIAHLDYKEHIVYILGGQQFKILVYAVFSVAIFLWLVVLYESINMLWVFGKKELGWQLPFRKFKF